ncbi:hypothetical protein N1030_11530 [Desulfovibrio mangrovi]|uniref:hypothetical protein n=1 Tax=Desulfovibrio mangrovi TaxID=2976983 RepID=UPI0022481C13|nr:hypothetical protein [Desulfovibrio mangrovi]UZP66251.1 hypothetical protein N1030_11530 [Desulfovibrio mangrovi]
MQGKIPGILWATLIFILSFTVLSVQAADVPRISTDEALTKLETAVIVDARSGADWSGSTLKIKGAIRGSLRDVAMWSVAIPKDKEVIVYCA